MFFRKFLFASCVWSSSVRCGGDAPRGRASAPPPGCRTSPAVTGTAASAARAREGKGRELQRVSRRNETHFVGTPKTKKNEYFLRRKRNGISRCVCVSLSVALLTSWAAFWSMASYSSTSSSRSSTSAGRCDAPPLRLPLAPSPLLRPPPPFAAATFSAFTAFGSAIFATLLGPAPVLAPRVLRRLPPPPASSSPESSSTASGCRPRFALGGAIVRCVLKGR